VTLKRAPSSGCTVRSSRIHRETKDDLFSLQNVRTRKCSIVQEEEDEDDVSSCSGRDERGSNSALNSFNRRGSRSEGKLSHILQERLSQLPEKHAGAKAAPVQRHPHQKEDTVIADRGERLMKPISSRNEKDNKTLSSSPAMQPKTASKFQTGNVLLEKLPTTCEENLKNRSADTNIQSSGWARKPAGTEVRPRSVTECLKPIGPAPANKWRMGSQHRYSVPATELPVSMIPPMKAPSSGVPTTTATTTILHESSTVSIPLHPIGDNQMTLAPKYKTMPPSPGSSPVPQITLNEILEDGDGVQASISSTECCSASTAKCRVVRRTAYEQRRSKFHKTRTASCSSSDASDDDSESRKKRAHKIGASAGKSLPPRRDSHDDSSDSQDPGGSGGGRGGVGSGGGGMNNSERTTTDTPTTTGDNSGGTTNTTNTSTTTTTTTGGGRHRCTENQVMFGRRHRAGRRRAGETRLRESQSLNRITEVQEAEAPSSCHNHCHMSRNTMLPGPQSVVSSSSSSSVSQSSMASQHGAAQPASHTAATTTVQKAKGLGARLLQGWSLGGRSLTSNKQSARAPDGRSNDAQQRRPDCQMAIVGDERRGSDHKCGRDQVHSDKENRGNGSINRNECKNRKIRLLSRYFTVHKKLCVPLPGIFGKGRLYKARSCGSITRDRVSPPSPKSMLVCPATTTATAAAAAEDKWRERRHWCDAATKQHRGSDGDINQNLGLAHLMQESIVGKGCTGVPTVCHIHLGDASKCCSLC